jgi:hypothetical protein
MTNHDIHYYAIRHNVTGLWWMSTTTSDGWTDKLWLADVWQPDDMVDEGDTLTPDAHWQAFTCNQYCDAMGDCPPMREWLDAIDAR